MYFFHIHFLHLTCHWTRNLDGFQEILHFQLRTEFNLLLMNLILCELLVVLIGIPADTIAAVQQGWDMGPLVCNVVGFCLTTLGNQSSWKHFLIAPPDKGVKYTYWEKVRKFFLFKTRQVTHQKFCYDPRNSDLMFF